MLRAVMQQWDAGTKRRNALAGSADMDRMTQESSAGDIEHVALVLADDLVHDLERLLENIAHAAEPNVQHVPIELQRIARGDSSPRVPRRARRDGVAARRPGG